jgi:hypothetical protein
MSNELKIGNKLVLLNGYPIKLPAAASDPSGVSGDIYFNTTSSKIRLFNGSIWQDLASGSLTLTGQPLLDGQIIVGNASDLSAVVDTDGVGDVTADHSTGLTINNLAVTNAKVATGIDAAKIADGSVSNAEFQYISTLSSNAQDQLDAKVDENAAITGATKTKITYDSKGLVTAGADLAASDLPTGIDAAKIADGSVSNAEFQYLNSVTSNVQDQLDAKVDENAAIVAATKTKITYDAKGLVTAGADLAASDLPTGIDAAKIADGSVSNAEFQYLNSVTSNVQDQLDAKVDENAAITGATKTKITYDSKGLVTAGTDATTSDIAEGTNLYFTDSRAKTAAVADAISDGVTDVAPSQNAVFDALALKANDADVIKKNGSVAFTAAQSMGGFKLTSVAAPTASGDAANKAYVDSVAEGLKPKQAVRAATSAAGTLASSFEAGDIIDGVTLATNDRILIKDQASASQNGIYVVQASGAPVRATDFDSLSPIDEVNGAMVAVQEGTLNAGKVYVQTGSVATIDTDPINFVFFNSSASLVGGDGITVSGNNISVDHDGNGLQFSANQLALELDGTTLSKSASGLKVNEIANSEIAAAAAIALDKLAATTASRALVSNASGFVSASATTSVELGYVSGVTSAIQTQLNDKASKALDNLASTAVNISILPAADDSIDLGSASLRWNALYAQNIETNNIDSPNSKVVVSNNLEVQGNITTEINGRSVGSATQSFDAGYFDQIRHGSDVFFILNGSDIDANTHKITNVVDPTADQDAATKKYVDDSIDNSAANKALSNLASVAINASLIAGSDGTLDLGSNSLQWKDIYITGALQGDMLRAADTGNDIFDISGGVINAGDETASISTNSRQLKVGATVKLDWGVTHIDVNSNKLINVADPTSAQDAATKAYADSKVADAINDGTTTVAPSQNAVFDALALKLSLSGGTMTGALNMDGEALQNVPAPSAGGDAANKTYVDDQDDLRATVALDNLASVAINTALLPVSTAANIDLGSGAKAFRNVYTSKVLNPNTGSGIDLINKKIQDDAGNDSIDYQSRYLKNGSTVKFDWFSDGNVNTAFGDFFNRGAIGASLTDVVSEQYVDSVSLTGSATVTALSYNKAVYCGVHIEYMIKTAAGEIRTGKMYVANKNDGSSVSSSDQFSETADCEVTLTTDYSSPNIRVRAANANGSAATMRLDVKYIRA